MTIYILLLRGINVGGNNMIKMIELKDMLEKMGLSSVQTYINSGNVVFESEAGAKALQSKIEQEIIKRLGLSVTVVLRTSADWARIMGNNPYEGIELAEGWSEHLILLTQAPSHEGIEKLRSSDIGVDEYHIDGEEIYILFRQSMLESNLAKHLSKLGVPMTMRNWNTVKKLDAMIKKMKSLNPHPKK
jgi:uncharacterized protein (DUF1697 family)